MITEKYREPSISKKKKREFEVLVKNNMKRAYFSALGLLGSHDSAMDISQEAFIRAYRNFNKYDPKRKFFTWYYKILKNLCLNFIRDNKSRKEENYLEYKINVSSDNPEKEVEQRELIDLLYKTISELNVDEREILVLREFEDYSYSEISEMLNIPEGTVMSRLYYARKKLYDKMKRKLL